MGSKQALSNGNESQEVEGMILEFERSNQVQIMATLALEDTPKGRVLRVEGVALNNHVDAVVRARWEFVRVALWGREYKSLVGLLTTLLYRLDFAIGEEEMRSIGIHKA